MARPLPTLLFLAYCIGFSSQSALTQSSPVSVGLEQTATISCTLQGVQFISSAYPSWYQQKPGKPPRLLIYKSRERASGVPERFSGETADNTATLTIARVQEVDEGDYYCAVWHNSVFVFGGGTHLTVTGQNPVHPSVFLFPPSQEEIKTKSKATLVCLMDEFHPGVIQVEWKADGTTISSGVETTKPLKQGNKYVASSYLTLSESDWKSHNKYACKVTHESKTIEKEVNRSECS
ncbi:immunoglobulin lambda-1 light chain-like isoform X11 [Sceloporus undulatus]|uniref:immunoglobulin lambda-1 light chain-like isoform X11 n=1 Tax=Sceloporus undulatus TaxID=8520 RepID=UPI001C4C02AB|nr:immunoglobulin lambda-1 light chain-like isoform X11 [Sceloporus undulatus]